jgi:hypothetical protein
MAEIAQKSLRVIALNASQKGKLRTVNIISTQAAETDKHRTKTTTQLTAAQVMIGIHETVMDSGGTVAGLPTIFISGYAGPN